ncbi:MAG: protein kinase [Planctomycetota bacterium]
MFVICPKCASQISLSNADLSSSKRLWSVVCSHCGNHFDARAALAAGKNNNESTKFSRKMPKRIGNYEVLAEINRGGMGIVYKAFDLQLRRQVAIKVLLAGEGASEEDTKRFQRETQAIARLQHSNIVPIYVVGTHEGKPYFVMDFIEGQTTKQLLSKGQMTPRLALSIIEGVAEALHHAHLNGVIHRDIKPGNILVDKFGHAQLMDFGLARRVDEDLDITQPGSTMGTPAYMSPEQAEGKLDEVDGQSDIYSAGACLYEFLTSRPPFDGPTTMAVLHKVVDELPAPCRQLNSKIHRDVETICMKCLERDKSARYANAKLLAEDIRRFNAGEAITAKPLGLIPTWLRKAKRHKEVTMAGLAIILTVIIASGYAIYKSHRATADKIQERQKIFAERLIVGRAALKQAQEQLTGLTETNFETKTTQARQSIFDAVTAYHQAQNMAPDDTETQHGLETLAKLDNDVEVRGHIFQARSFLKPVQLQPDSLATPPNYAAAEYAASLALKRNPKNVEALELRKIAIGIRSVQIETNGAQAEIFAKRIMDGDRRLLSASYEHPLGKSLGKTPVRGRELERGLYILNFARPNLPPQQATLWVTREASDDDLLVKITINTPEENMVIIPEGQSRLPQQDWEKLSSFAIDRFEYPNQAGFLPLTDATPIEARSLCEKQGKKVCSSLQWVRACMGDNGRPFPYGKLYVSGICAAGFDIDVQKQPPVSGLYSRCRTPEGVYDMSGNVAEWTEGDQQDTDFGGDWTSSTKYAQLTVSCHANSSPAPEELKNYRARLGFRCCKAK